MNALELLKKHEGFRDNYYYDSLGNLTVGWGHLVPKPSISQLENWFGEDYSRALHDARAVVGEAVFQLLAAPRKAVLINMAFNLGLSRLTTFKRMRHALIDGDWSTAADEMLHSRWASQVGNRAIELAQIMRSGAWPDDLE